MQQNQYAAPTPEVFSNATVFQAGNQTEKTQSGKPQTQQSPAEPKPAGQVAGKVTILQSPGDSHPKLCQVLLTSYPPQCTGPSVLGEVDWVKIGAEEVSGTRWADDVWVLGSFDSEKGELTLTALPSREAPAGAEVSEKVDPVPYNPNGDDEAAEERFTKARKALDSLFQDKGPIAMFDDYSNPGKLTVVLWAQDAEVEKKVRELIGRSLSADEYGFDALLKRVS